MVETLPVPPAVSGGEFSGLRLLHAANYHFDKDGSMFFNIDHKLHQGFVQLGCYVYPFSINDRARMLSFTGSKTFGKGKANQALLRTCINFHPDLLVLGHGQYISRQTLSAIRNELPDLRIAFWYIDPIWEGSRIEHIHQRADLFDAIFCTTGGKYLQQFVRPGTPAAFFPNPVDISIERQRAFESLQPEFDLLFFGRDSGAPERRELLLRLKHDLRDLRLGIFGSLGQPLIFGHAKEQVLAKSRMALNLSRRVDVDLYSSDRVSQLTGNGLLTLTPHGSGMDLLYSADEMAYYADYDELVSRIRDLRAHDAERIRIARNGWQKSHEQYSARRTARFLLNLTLRRPDYQEVCWSQHIFWHPNDRASLPDAA